MASWEFLLQKRGDKSWLPLESPTIEILAGEYRLAARSALLNRTVQINWQYDPGTDAYPGITENVEQTTSAEGLLLVMPFTNFTEGTWHINCSLEAEFSASLELVILEQQIEAIDVPQITLNTTHFLLDRETTLQITGTASQEGTMTVVVMHPQNLTPIFDRSFTVAGGPFSLPIELPLVVDFLVLLGEIRWQEHTVATLTFTFPGERLRPQEVTKPEIKRPDMDIKLPPVKTTTMQPLAPPKEQVTNGKVTVIDPDELFQELDDIFTPIDNLLQQPAPPPKVEEFVPPPVPQILLQAQDGQYEAGRPLALRATIPKQSGSWAIKLWVKDCQTRKIVDGPRWLLDWTPKGDSLQTETYLSFPLGSMMVTIEAITVELTSAAQSRKFCLECPLNLVRRTT